MQKESIREVVNLKIFYCNCVERMAKNFNLQDNEKYCIFVTKDKRQAIILTMSYIEYLQVLTAKVVWNFLFLIVIFQLSILKMIKGEGLMTPRRLNIYIKHFSWNTKPKNKLETQRLSLELKTFKMYEIFICSERSFMAKSTFLNSNITLQNTRSLSLSNHIQWTLSHSTPPNSNISLIRTNPLSPWKSLNKLS